MRSAIRGNTVSFRPTPSGDAQSKRVQHGETPAPRAKKHRGETLTIATVNDDFNTPRSNVRHVKADVIMVQEAKNENLHKLAKDHYGVHQNVKREDQAGSGLLWDKRVGTAKRSGYALGVTPHGAGMLTRWINYTDLKVGDAKVRMVSVHRPPARFKRLWPMFDRQLASFVRHSKLPVVIGLDANERNPQGLAKKCGLHWSAPKGSIDGFLVSPGISVEKVWRLPKGTSDHHPVVAKITVHKRAAR